MPGNRGDGHALGEHRRRREVAEAVEYVPAGVQAGTDESWLPRRRVELVTPHRPPRPWRTEQEPVVAVLADVAAQLKCDGARDLDRAHLLCLWRRQDQLAADASQLPIDGNESLREIEPILGEAKDFPDPQAGRAESDRGPISGGRRLGDADDLVPDRHIFGTDAAVGLAGAQRRSAQPRRRVTSDPPLA